MGCLYYNTNIIQTAFVVAEMYTLFSSGMLFRRNLRKTDVFKRLMKPDEQS